MNLAVSVHLGDNDRWDRGDIADAIRDSLARYEDFFEPNDGGTIILAGEQVGTWVVTQITDFDRAQAAKDHS